MRTIADTDNKMKSIKRQNIENYLMFAQWKWKQEQIPSDNFFI